MHKLLFNSVCKTYKFHSVVFLSKQQSQQNNELHVYSCQKNQQKVETPLPLETCHGFDSGPSNSLVPILFDSIDDLPIAVRKGVCSYT